MATGRFVAYFRVSTDKQGRSGLGLEAQRKLVEDYLNGGRWQLIGEYTEVETGRKPARLTVAKRPQLQAALANCRKHKATLVFAELGRLARNVAFISGLMESGVPFVVADCPNATPFELHIRAAMLEEEGRKISERTRLALAAAKRRGKRLGSPCPDKGAKIGTRVARRQAQQRADNLAATVAGLRTAGVTTLQGIADALNARGVPTARGGSWAPTTVSRLLARI